MKEGDRWTIVVEGVPSSSDFEMVWDPVFSPCGQHVLAKVESGGKYLVLADGQTRGSAYDALWEPAFSPDGSHVLLRYLENGKYCRQVVPSGELLG